MKRFLILTIFLSVSFKSFCQTENYSDDKMVARAGDVKISEKEFQERYDFTPHPRTTQSLDTALVKKEYLYTLLAEKLLAQKAKYLKIDTTKFIQGMLNFMERLFVRDALYKKVILSKVKITNAEIAEAKYRLSKLLIIKYLYSTNKNDIQKLYSKLQNGIPIDSLIVGRSEEQEQKTPETISYGSLDENVENSVYALKVGQFTSPIFTGYRFYIFYLKKIIVSPYFNTQNDQFKINQIIKKRLASKLEDDYLYNYLHQFRINVDRALFTKILFQLQNFLIARQKSYIKKDKPKYYYLVDKDFDKIDDSLGSQILNSIFIKYQSNPETVEQFLMQLKYNGFRVDTTNPATVGRAFNNYVKNYLESELLAREGEKLNLEMLPSVQNDIRTWEDYYLSQQMMKKIQDSISVSDADAYAFYAKNHDIMFPTEKIEVQEILVDSLETIQKALDELNKQIPFEIVSEKYSILDSLRVRGGYLGYLPPTQKGTIGEIKMIAKKMKIGEVYGPVKLSDGYALLKLIDVQNAGVYKDTSFIQVKDELIEVMKNIEFDKKLKSYVADLALKYGVTINNHVFNSIPIYQFNTVVIRMIGFGGKIYSFPYEPLFADWYDVYLKKKSEVP